MLILRVIFITLLLFTAIQARIQLLERIESFERLSYTSVPDEKMIRLVGLGFEHLIADIYWLIFINYIGDLEARAKDKFERAEQYLELITSLDPGFVQVYWFTAFVLGDEAGKPEAAARIIHRGIESNISNWRLPYIAGVNKYLFSKDPESAAKYYKLASSYPGAPAWLASQAKLLALDIPAQVKEAYTWVTLYETSEQPRVKAKARERAIEMWTRIYAVAPSEVHRIRAREVLHGLGVNNF